MITLKASPYWIRNCCLQQNYLKNDTYFHGMFRFGVYFYWSWRKHKTFQIIIVISSNMLQYCIYCVIYAAKSIWRFSTKSFLYYKSSFLKTTSLAWLNNKNFLSASSCLILVSIQEIFIWRCIILSRSLREASQRFYQ